MVLMLYVLALSFSSNSHWMNQMIRPKAKPLDNVYTMHTPRWLLHDTVKAVFKIGHWWEHCQTNKQKKTTIIVSLQSPPTVLGLVSQSVPVLVRTPLCSLAMWKRTVEHRSSFLPKARQHAPISFSPVVHLSSVSAAARGWDRLLGLHILFMWRLWASEW